MAIDIEIEVGQHEVNRFKEFLYRWWKQRRARWREQMAPDPWKWIDGEVKAMQRGKRPRGYYDRLAERADYVSPQVAEMYLGMERVRQEKQREIETFFGSRFGRLKGYGPAEAVWSEAMALLDRGKGVAEVGYFLEVSYQGVVAQAKRDYAEAEALKRLAEEGRKKSLEDAQRRMRQQS